MDHIDAAIVAAYFSGSESVDRIVCFQVLRRLYLDKLPPLIRSVGDDQID